MPAHEPKAPHARGWSHCPLGPSWKQSFAHEQVGGEPGAHCPPLAQKGTSQSSPVQQADSQTQLPPWHVPCGPQSLTATHLPEPPLSSAVQPASHMHIPRSQKFGPTPQSFGTQSEPVLVWQSSSLHWQPPCPGLQVPWPLHVTGASQSAPEWHASPQRQAPVSAKHVPPFAAQVASLKVEQSAPA